MVGRAKGTTVERRGPPLQLAAWGLPALQTVAVLVLRDVDADELTGNLSRYVFFIIRFLPKRVAYVWKKRHGALKK